MAFVCSLGTDQSDAEEIVQKVFIRFWDQVDKYDWSRDPKPYLFQSAKNATWNHFRDLKKHWELDQYESELSEEPQVLEKIQLSELENHIDRLIDELPPRCRMVFVLSRKEGLSNKQIAAVLEISEKTVENQMTKALKTMRKALE